MLATIKFRILYLPVFFPNTHKINVQNYEVPCCFVWGLTLKGKYRLTGSENKMIKRILGPKIEEVVETGENDINRWAQIGG
jgi:hypothetical protein